MVWWSKAVTQKSGKRQETVTSTTTGPCMDEKTKTGYIIEYTRNNVTEGQVKLTILLE